MYAKSHAYNPPTPNYMQKWERGYPWGHASSLLIAADKGQA